MNKTLILLLSLIMIPIFVILTDEGVLFGSASASTTSTTSGSNQLSNRTISRIANVPLDIVGVIASSNNNGTNNSNYAVDGNLSSRWSAKGNDWIEVDLGSEQLVKKVDISWRPGSANDTRTRVYSFDILVINDETGKADYVDLDNKGITHSSILVNEPDGFAGNRVRINCYGNSVNNWNGIQEIKVWGNKLTTPSMQGVT